MKRRYTALMLALLMLAQVFAPEVARAKSSEPAKQTTVQLVKMGALDPKTYPKLDNKAILAIQKQARNKQNGSRAGSSGFFSAGSPYLPGQHPSNDEKAAAYGNLRVDFVTEGLKDNGVIKPFQWNEIFGTDSNGNPGTANIYFVQRDVKTNQKINTFKLTVDKAGKYSLNDLYGKPAKLPLYSKALEPYKYEAELEIGVSEKVTLLTFKLSETGSEHPSYTTDSEGKLVADIPLYLKIGQTASTKFVSKWNTNAEEANRPKVVGGFNNKTADDYNYFPFPINDTDVLKIRREQFDLNKDEWPGYMPQTPMQLREMPNVTVDEDMLEDPSTYTIDKNAKRITATDGTTYKYDFTYDVIDGGKLTMTEIIPVTFDANGGKFASITDPNAEQKIVKEVEYDGTLTDKAEAPTKDRETFKGWSETKGGTTPVTDDAFKDITKSKTLYAIWDNNDIVADQLEVKESFKDGDTWVNAFIPSLDTLKGQVKIKDAKGVPQPLTNDDKFVIVDGSNEYTTDEQLKTYLYDKLKEKDDGNKPSRTETVKAKVTHANGTTQTVDISIKVIKNIYEAKTLTDKPFYAPDGYVKVVVDPTTKAKDPQKTFYYVNPEAKVVIPGKDPVGTGDNKFVKWTMKADNATGNGTDYALVERHKFTEASTIEAQYVSDVIPQEGTEKPDTVPANFVEVKFVPTEKATEETKAEKIFWVNPEKAVTIPVKNPVGKQYFTFKEWKMGANADGATYTPSTAQKFTEPTTVITATYDEAKNIIPYNPEEPITRPDGYVRVTFAADPGLKLTEQKAYYVKQNAKDEHGTALTLASLAKPTYEAQTGYKFDKWDKEDSLVIEAADIVVTAKATKRDTVIPAKGQPNEKPDGYKTVTFVIKTGDEAKGSLEGVTKYYVNPTEYAKITPPEAKPNTGYVFGSWDKDPTIPTVYKEDTTITGSFNELGAIIPKTNPDGTENKQPAGYVRVTFMAIGEGYIPTGETRVYFVNPEKEVTITPPKAKGNTGYEFNKWNQDTTESTRYPNDTIVTANFKKLDAIIPSTDGDGKPNPKPEGYVTVTFLKGNHGELSGQTIYYVNPKAVPTKKLGDPSIVKPTVTPEIGYTFDKWSIDDKELIKNNKSPVAGYKELPDVVPKDNPGGGENKQPNGYITVTFSTETNGKIKGTDKTKKVVYVNPNKAVALDKFAPQVDTNTGFDFADWDTSITKAIQYKDGDVIKAKYNPIGAVIPKISEDTKKPAGYVTVTFDKGTNGKSITGTTVYYVDPNKEVTVTAPAVTPNTGYKQKTGAAAWDKALTQKFTAENTTITAQYEEIGDVIPQKNTDGSDKPNGYVTVKFEAVNGTLSGTTTYYVNGEKEVDLTNTAEGLTKKPNVGYKAEGTWDKLLKAKFADGDVLTFTFKELADVIEDKPGATKPDGYVTVKLIPTGKATDATKAEKTYWVNPKKEVTIPSTNPVGKKITDANDNTYTFTFKEWTSTSGIHGIWKPGDEIKGTFTQDTDITAKYNVKAEKLVNGPIAKDNVVTPKGDVPNAGDLIKNIPGSGNNPLPDGTTFTYKGGNPDLSEPGEKTVVVEVHYPNGKTAIVEVPVKVVDNVVPQTSNEKPKVPDNYVKVTVDTTNKATDNTKFTKIFWVKTGVEVTIPDIQAPTGKPETVGGVTNTNNFDKWQRQGANPAKFYDKEIKDTFTGDTTIVATYTVKDNVPPQGKDNQLIPQGSNPSPKDFIKNPYDDNDPNNKDNLPPGTRFEFVPGTEPDTSKPGEGKTTIKVIYPNGEEKTVEVPFRVTDDVVEQPDPNDPNTKPAVPDNFVKVTVDPTDQAKDSTPRVFWVNPEKVVEIPVGNPTANDGNKIFKGWDSPLKQQFRGETTIKATFGPMPRPTSDYVFTEQGVQPTPQDYKNAITPPAGKRIKDVVVVERPNVDKPGKTSATVKVIYEDGTTDQISVPVFVQKKDTPTPDLRPYPVPGDCNNRCDQPNQPNQPNVGKDALNTTDHYQYLIGYPDGNFAPNKGMTRAEAATMFTRLLRERPIKWRHYNAGLNDIRPGDWYADTVGYAVQRGIVSGYPDGSFKPNKPITRAEFAAIASRFDALAQGNTISFSDLAPSHWGYNAIRSAATKGWISGYPDNTFRPEQAITRAEVTAITNRMLNRHADLYWIDAHPRDVIRFGDVKRSDWYFEPIMEATMGHDFIRDRDKKTEHWTGINGKSFI